MAFKKPNQHGKVLLFFSLLDTSTLDQHMLILSEYFNGISIAHYSTLTESTKEGFTMGTYIF